MSELSDKALDLHKRLIAGDPTATARLAQLLFPRLISHLRIKFGGEHERDYAESASDALMEYLADPTKFDPNKAHLDTYLKYAATRDMMNLKAKVARRSERIELVDPVELPEPDGNNKEHRGKDPVLQGLLDSADEEELTQLVQRVFTDGIDREIARLIVDDVRETVVYTEVLGIGNLPVDEQRSVVKRHKDRVKARLKRIIGLKK